jgi:hypothetical protein
MLANGVPPKVAAERLGHGDTTLFTNLFSHVTPTIQREAAERIGSALFSRRAIRPGARFTRLRNALYPAETGVGKFVVLSTTGQIESFVTSALITPAASISTWQGLTAVGKVERSR